MSFGTEELPVFQIVVEDLVVLNTLSFSDALGTPAIMDITGNAGTATALQTARLIGNVSFDGTADIVPEQIAVAAAGAVTTVYPMLSPAATGDLQPITDTDLSYNAATNVLTAPTFAGALTGNADTATALQTARNIGGVSFDGTASIVPQDIDVADAGGDTTTWVLLAPAITGTNRPRSDAELTYNATSNALTTTTFIGALTGNADTASLAAEATVLETARTINGVSFDGSANITVTAAAGTLTGTTLNATVVNSSLTSIGTLVSGAVPASLVTAGTFGAGGYTFPGTLGVSGGAGYINISTSVADVLRLTRTGTAVNTVISLTNDSASPIYIGLGAADTFAIKSDANIGTSPVFSVDVTNGNTNITGTLDVDGTTTLNGNMVFGNASGDLLTIRPAAWTLSNAVTITGTWTDLGIVSTVDINGGSIDSTVIGGVTPAAGTFTTLSASSTLAVTGSTTLTGTLYADGDINQTANNGGLVLSGGTTNNLGANLILYGQSHASFPGHFTLRDDTTSIVNYDASAATPVLTFSPKVDFDGYVNLTGTVTGANDRMLFIDGQLDGTPTNTYGMVLSSQHNSGSTVGMYGGYFRVDSEDAIFTTTSVYGVYISGMTKGAQHTVTTETGLRVANITSGGTNYAIYTGLGTVRFGDAVTMVSTLDVTGDATFSDQLIVGSTTALDSVLTVSNPAVQFIGTDVSTANHVLSRFSNDAGNAGLNFLKSRNATPGSHTTINANDGLGSIRWGTDDGTDYDNIQAYIYVQARTNPSGSVWSTEMQFFQYDAAGFGYSAMTIDGETYDVTFNTRTVVTEASATARAGLRLPHGAAPTSPTNGDMWTTTAGLYVRINGSTVGPLS